MTSKEEAEIRRYIKWYDDRVIPGFQSLHGGKGDKEAIIKSIDFRDELIARLPKSKDTQSPIHEGQG